jgi:hypothetical protein
MCSCCNVGSKGELDMVLKSTVTPLLCSSVNSMTSTPPNSTTEETMLIKSHVVLVNKKECLKWKPAKSRTGQA